MPRCQTCVFLLSIGCSQRKRNILGRCRYHIKHHSKQLASPPTRAAQRGLSPTAARMKSKHY